MPAGKTKEPHAARNYKLPGGVMRFSKSRMYQIRGVYKKKPYGASTAAGKKPSAEQFKVKKIGGEKNGGERRVRLQKVPRSLDSERELSYPKPNNKPDFQAHKRHLKKSLTPGTVVIMLAGRHKGKRAIFLKQLASGLCLVTGPMKLNSCPMRRINQTYVIATQTKIDVSKVKVPDHIDDDYFRRSKRQRRTNKGDDADIFAARKEEYQVSDQRKADQQTVDKAILGVIRSQKDKKLYYGYLGSTFSLKKGQHPHNMVF